MTQTPENLTVEVKLTFKGYSKEQTQPTATGKNLIIHVLSENTSSTFISYVHKELFLIQSDVLQVSIECGETDAWTNRTICFTL